MSLAINIDAGPLSQIGLEIASVTTAVQLATGAYGWYKARERSQSLNQLLSSSGGELVTTSAFNINTYKSVRTRCGPMYGAAVQDRTIHSVKLPKADTSIPDHPGLACLRALTAGLLSLCGLEATTAVLQDVIPTSLIQYHQEDKEIEIEGSVLAGLKQWVAAVATEEDSNPFRKATLEAVRERHSKFTEVPLNEISDLEFIEVSDLNLLIGFVRWALMPLHSRPMNKYPTRSLMVWTMAFILSELGFSIQASTVAVRKTSSYEDKMNSSLRFPFHPTVFLVLANAGETDPMMVQQVLTTSDDLPRAQPTLIRGIPWLAFRHLRAPLSGIGTQFLAEVWNYSFQTALSSFRKLEVEAMQVRVYLHDRKDERFIPENYRALLSEFSPHLLQLCEPAMTRFVPLDSRAKEWQADEITQQLNVLRLDRGSRYQVPESCYIMLAIIHGSIYGLCSATCIQNKLKLSGDSEIAFSPDAVYGSGSKSLENRAKFIGDALRGSLNLDKWSDLIYELFLSIGTGPSWTPQKKTTLVAGQKVFGNPLILGAQRNGFTAVSEALVLPTIRPSALGHFHIGRGQILNFPLTDDGYIQASTHLQPPVSLNLAPDPRTDRLYRFEDYDFSGQMRLDVEPCWEDDPRTVVFRLRESGTVVAPLNIALIFDRLANSTEACRCGTPSFDPVAVSPSDQWQLVSLYQLRRKNYYPGLSMKRASVDNCQALVDASQSELATAYALGIVQTSDLYVAGNCLKCAVNRALLTKSEIENYECVVLIRCDFGLKSKGWSV